MTSRAVLPADCTVGGAEGYTAIIRLFGGFIMGDAAARITSDVKQRRADSQIFSPLCNAVHISAVDVSKFSYSQIHHKSTDPLLKGKGNVDLYSAKS